MYKSRNQARRDRLAWIFLAAASAVLVPMAALVGHALSLI